MSEPRNILHGDKLGLDTFHYSQKLQEKLPSAVNRAATGGIAGKGLTWRAARQKPDFRAAK